LGGFSNVSPLKAAVSSGYFTVLHAGIWLWPFNQMAVLGGYYWGQVSLLELAGDALVVLAAVVLSIRWRWRYPCVALGTIWFLLAFAPMSNILGFRNGPYCDSYIALASVGMAFALAAILRGLWPLRMTAPARIAAVVIIASVIASRAAAVFEAASWSYAWNNPLVAYERTLRTFPQAFDAMTELAKCYMDRGEYRKADDLTAKSIELAPDRSSSYAIRAVVAKQEGRMEDAMNWLKIYNSKIEKVDAWGLTFLADIYADQMRQPEKAEALYRKAIVRRPWSQDAFRAAYELAYLSAVQGRQTEAVSLWEELLVYQPDDKVLHWNLSLAYAKQGDQKLASYHRSLAQSLGQQSNVQSTNAGGIQ
jgi:tetratricopeptide (TPR) repeat protein